MSLLQILSKPPERCRIETTFRRNYLCQRSAQGTFPCVDKTRGVVNSAPVTLNSSVSRDKSIEYTHGNNIASYSYNTTGTGENEKINGTQGSVPCARMTEIFERHRSNQNRNTN